MSILICGKLTVDVYNERRYNLSNYYGMIPLVSHTYWHIYKKKWRKSCRMQASII